MSTCQPFLLVEIDEHRFAELQAQQNARTDQDGALGLGWTNVYVGELVFTIQVQTPKTALFETRRQDDTHCMFACCKLFSQSCRQASQASQKGRRTCVLLFYKRVFGLQSIPMYGLRVCDAFALQHNWNRESYREYFDQNSVRARLLHDLDDACNKHKKPRHALLVNQPARPANTARPTRPAKKANSTVRHQAGLLSFRDVASAVVLFDKCPVNLGTRRVAPTNALILKQIMVATNNDCDIGHTSAAQEILVDFQVYCGNNNFIRFGDLCRQLAQHNLKDLVPASMQQLLEKAATKCQPLFDDSLHDQPARYVHNLSDISFSMDLRLVREIRVRTFDVAQDVVVLHNLLDNLLSWKTDKRYRFKSRKYEKQTYKPAGKALLVKTGLQIGWLDHSQPGFQSVNHKWRKRCRLAKRAVTRQKKRFWQNCLLDPDCAFGLRKARTGIRHTVS
jgi:hypothetical protein